MIINNLPFKNKMKKEFEITVHVKSDYETLKKELEKYNFKIVEEFELNDIYMINKDTDLSKLSTLDILKKCILVRDKVNIRKLLLYKYKNYAENWDIIEEWKVECPITDISKAVEFMETINYKKLFEIHDKCIAFANEESELVVQIVNDKYIFIEMESNCVYINRKYSSIDELKEDINRYNLPINKSTYFAKKAEIILKEVLKISN